MQQATNERISTGISSDHYGHMRLEHALQLSAELVRDLKDVAEQHFCQVSMIKCWLEHLPEHCSDVTTLFVVSALKDSMESHEKFIRLEATLDALQERFKGQ